MELSQGYLAELAAQDIPTVPTVVVRSNGTATAQLPDLGSDEIVIKPAVSAGARGAGRFDAGSQAAREHLRSLLDNGDALVQEFRPEVSTGERSLMFLGGTFSHAVLKTPAVGDFRVQEHHGGRNTVHRASARELDVAQAALAAVPSGADLLYARVDLIGDVQRPLLMELELIEPYLFLPMSEGSAGHLAEAIATEL